jgi:hypothetical protein
VQPQWPVHWRIRISIFAGVMRMALLELTKSFENKSKGEGVERVNVGAGRVCG